MKEKILNNFGLKVISVVLAIILWVTIINVSDPSTPKQISGIPVNMLNQETLTEQGYTFNILEGNTVTITVYGPKSIVDDLVASDFYASADFSTISPLSDFVDINVQCVKAIPQSNLDITLKTTEVKLNVENREVRNIDVEVLLTGTAAEGHVPGDYDISPISIKVTGAESEVSSIAKIVAEYDIEGASLDISDTVAVHLYDEDGNEISKKNLILSRDTIRLKVPILIKKKVPVNYAMTGSVKEGYKISNVSYSINEVEIAGTQAVLDSISSIDLPADLINVTDLNTSAEYTVRLSHYVPSNVRILADDVVSEVKVEVEPLITKEFTVPTANIIIENENDLYNYGFTRENFTVKYTGLSSDIEKISTSDITAKIDVLGFGIGTRTLRVDVAESIGNCTLAGECFVNLMITK